MTFEQAIVQMMRKYWKAKHGGFETAETYKSSKYTKEYFDRLKEEFTGESSKDHEDKPKRKKASKNGY